MVKDFWINLPVKDINKSKAFFEKLGFTFNTKYGNTDTSVALAIGNKHVVVMLFAEGIFEGFTKNKLTDTAKSSEVLLSIDAETKEEVREMAKKATDAGGTVFSQPGGDGWLYGCGFADLDGHRWNVLYMDMSQMPK